MMNVLLIDNNDSFTYNIVDLLRRFSGINVAVLKSPGISIRQIDQYDKFILSPGPGLPTDFPVLTKIIREYYQTKSMLGICLGHQAIGTFFSAELKNLTTVFHGQAREIVIPRPQGIFKGLPSLIKAGHYHSWILDKDPFPDELEITAFSQEEYIMAISHKKYDLHGIQFHPESFMCEYGFEIFKNFLHLD